MKRQYSLIVATVIFTFFIMLQANAFAYMIDFSSHEGLSGGAWAEVDGDGTKEITFGIGLESGTIADIRSFFFDIEGLPVTSIIVNSLTDLNNDFDKSDVITNWLDVSGNAGMQGAGFFDFGIQFGSGGVGNNKGDIRAVNFTVFSDSVLNLGDDFGMRLMSFGANREDSRKMLGSLTTPAPVPEPTTMLLFGTGLIGLAGVARKKKK